MSWFTRLRYRAIPYDPLLRVMLSHNALEHNLSVFREHCPEQHVAPVLKSNAYGHGLITIAKLLEQTTIPFFVIDSYYEAIQLRRAGITQALLIIDYTPNQTIVTNRLPNVAFTIAGIEQLQALATQAKRDCVIHLKFDTGMHRQGLQPEESLRAQKLLVTNTHLKLQGICSHLADADIPDSEFTEQQLHRWDQVTSFWYQHYPTLPYMHLAATNGAVAQLTDNTNVLRVGLGLFGISPETLPNLHLQPVLQLETIITGLRTIEPGERVGYNGIYTATTPRRLATLPVGFYEGLDRRLSNKGSVLIRNQACPIVGRVSMNLTSVDITDLPSDITIGEPVTVISRDPAQSNSIQNLAALCETSAYEILVRIPSGIRREIVTI